MRLLSVITTTTALLLACAGISAAGMILTIDQVRERALEYNRQLLSARKELDRAQGEIISARSGALPTLALDGRYTRNLTRQEIFLGDEKIPISQNNDFDFSLSLTQPLYLGGKINAALAIAKIYKNYSEEKVKEAERDIVFLAESYFYSAILAETNLDVIKKADAQLTYNLDIAEKYFGQGMISEYELLRARVEKLNIEPQLVAAESDLSVSRKQLKSFLGISLGEEISLITPSRDTSLAETPELDSLIYHALNNRPEMQQAKLEKQGYKKAVQIARSGWFYPNLHLNGTYSWSASTDDLRIGGQEHTDSWNVSLMLNIPLFDGGRTVGEVRKAQVDYYQADLAEKQLYDDIVLEVEQAYDNLIQSGKALATQTETIAQAEEGMRIADLRYESGVGTQLEVLSAQTALTQARSQLAQTVFHLRLAKAALKKATGYDIY